MVIASLDDGTMVGGLEAVAKDPMMGVGGTVTTLRLFLFCTSGYLRPVRGLIITPTDLHLGLSQS